MTASNLENYQAGTDERLTTAELVLWGDGETAGAGLVARVNENEALIRATADELTSKIELKADRIDLNGYVTASEFSTLEADLAKVTSGTVQASHLYTQNLTATNTVRLAGHTCEWKSATFLTSSTSLTVNASGETVTGVTLNRKTATIDYLGT